MSRSIELSDPFGPCLTDGLDRKRQNRFGELAYDRVEVFVLGDEAIDAGATRFDELIVHWRHRLGELASHTRLVTAALFDIAFESTRETRRFVALAKDPKVESLGELGKGEQQDAFGNDNLGRWEDKQVVFAAMVGKVVDRNCHVEPSGEAIELKTQQIGIERIGVVKVDLIALFEAEVAKVFVIGIERNQRDPFWAKGVL